MSKKIAWEKWWNVEGDSLEASPVLESTELSEKMDQLEDNSEFFTDFLFEKEKINTPFGFYFIDDPLSPTNMFDCWICYTNFPITQEVHDLIDNKVEGIGAFKVISKYRFFIGVEKLFSFSDVRTQIHDLLCTDDEILESERKILDIMSQIKHNVATAGNAENWALFIGNDHTIKFIKLSDFTTKEDYLKHLQELKSMKNGNIITYDHL